MHGLLGPAPGGRGSPSWPYPPGLTLPASHSGDLATATAVNTAPLVGQVLYYATTIFEEAGVYAAGTIGVACFKLVCTLVSAFLVSAPSVPCPCPLLGLVVQRALRARYLKTSLFL